MSRYIDADLLKNRISEHKRIAIHKDDIVKIISDIPTADIEEVKHGQWLNVEDNDGNQVKICSHCAREGCYESTYEESFDYDYNEIVTTMDMTNTGNTFQQNTVRGAVQKWIYEGVIPMATLKLFDDERLREIVNEVLDDLVVNGLTVKECIKKQVPKKPIDVCKIPFDIPIGVCSVCGNGVNEDMRFCDICGNALDWSD